MLLWPKKRDFRTDTFRKLNAAMNNVDGDTKQIMKGMQAQIEYLMAKCKAWEETAIELNNGKAVTLSDDRKKRIAVKGKELNEFLLGEVEKSFSPSTIFGWYRQLVGQKYNSVGPNQKKRGRPAVSQEVVYLIVKLAKHNPDWGYERISAVLSELGYTVSKSTVRNVLDDYGLTPDSETRTTGSWWQFWATQEAVTAAIDYAHTEVLTPTGLVRYSSFFCMDCGTREVRCGGVVLNPTGIWATQVARNWCDMWDGFLLGKKFLVCDNDCTYIKSFCNVFKSIGIRVKRTRPYTPAMNGRMENFIRALKLECLDKIIFRSEKELKYAINQFLEYWNHYRPNSAIGGKMVKPYEQSPNGRIIEVSFLGGLFHGYRREKLAA